MQLDDEEFASCRKKIERAREHFESIRAEVLAWLETRPLRLIKEGDDAGHLYKVLVEVADCSPFKRWALIAGDCVHNLRSALDNLLYSIAIIQTGQNPPVDEKLLQFPISATPDKFKDQKKKIKSLSFGIQFMVEQVQPYNSPHWEFPPLLDLLATFDNQDKHRMLNVVAATPHHAAVELSHDPNFKVSSITPRWVIIDGKTEILSFTITPPNPELKFQCDATMVICISHPLGPSKIPFSELARVLDSLITEVERVAVKLISVL